MNLKPSIVPVFLQTKVKMEFLLFLAAHSTRAEHQTPVPALHNTGRVALNTRQIDCLMFLSSHESVFFFSFSPSAWS